MSRHVAKILFLSVSLAAIGPASSPAQPAAAAPAAPGDPVSPQGRWQPPGGGVEIPLWPAGTVIALPAVTGPETAHTDHGGRIPGGYATAVRNVVRPTMTIYPARGHNTGAALMVYPGGGYEILAIDLEGTEICDWATARGITCVVVKYRVPWSGPHWDAACRCQTVPPVPMALQDAQRAMGLLRQRAAGLGVDPRRIGVVGFSAGGHLVTAISNATGRAYAPVDAADGLSARPDFAIALYPGHLWSDHGTDLFAWDPIRADAPPTMLIQAQDDPVDDVRNSISYFLALQAKNVPAELHIYAHGGHAFGIRPTAQPISHWPELVERWLHGIGMIQ